MDSEQRVEQAKERLERIKRDPERVLFSDFKGVSRSGAATVWVDMLGRMKRIHIPPHTLYEGAEPWLIGEIMSAYSAAQRSADFVDFDFAEFAQELDNALSLKDKIMPRMESAECSEKRRARSGRDDDDDWFDQESILR